IFDIPHIISDGKTISILINELIALYSDRKVPKPDFQFKDYSEWLLKDATEYKLHSKSFWVDQFIDFHNRSTIPYDFNLKEESVNFNGDVYNFTLPEDKMKIIYKACEDYNCSVFMILFTAFSLTLSKYSGNEDVVIGTPIDSRRFNSSTSNMMGMFVNTLAIKVNCNSDFSNDNYIKKTIAHIINCFEHGHYPFEMLVNDLNISRDLRTNPIFDVLFTMHQNTYDDLNGGNLKVEFIEQQKRKIDVDLSLDVAEIEEEIVFNLVYANTKYEKTTIISFVRDYINILDYLIEGTGKKISSIKTSRVLDISGRKIPMSNKISSIVDIFENTCELKKDEIAVTMDNESITYNELQIESNIIANNIIEKYDSKNVPVVILYEKSIKLLSMILGVLKARKSYIIINPSMPQDRIKGILSNENIQFVISEDVYLHDIYIEGDIVLGENMLKGNKNKDFPIIKRESTDIMYTIYTSGSTGLPKGIKVTHSNMINIYNGWKDIYDLQNHKVILQLANITFDVFTGDWIRGLLSGLTMVLCPAKKKLDIPFISELIVNYKVNLFETTPQLGNLLMNYLYQEKANVEFLDIVILGSDTLRTKDYISLKKMSKDSIRFINSYGLTETTVDSTYYEMSEEQCMSYDYTNTFPIGIPYPNVDCYILNDDNIRQPIGVEGELCIGGNTVSNGYINNADLNEKKFIKNPYSKGRLFKTGDIVKYDKNGIIHFIGRKDRLYKIRGQRVELGDIENAAMNSMKIKKAIVLPVETYDNLSLILFYTSKNLIDKEDFILNMSKKVPKYMIPDHFYYLTEIPLSENDKIDVKKLQEYGGNIISKERKLEKPENDTENQILDLWKSILGHNNISVLDSFFDVGGNSILLIKLHVELKKCFDNKLTIADLFTYPSIRTLSLYFKNNQNKRVSVKNKIEDLVNQLEREGIKGDDFFDLIDDL
ncbi:MAG: non-ribosomal peptide synthetase, partial [Flavobacteriaceae bacterium]|nr:non-ribosomal peptide synthetase [Flavobacteriaceae bacterium]